MDFAGWGSLSASIPARQTTAGARSVSQASLQPSGPQRESKFAPTHLKDASSRAKPGAVEPTYNSTTKKGVVPMYQSHLGDRESFEKKFELKPGESHLFNKPALARVCLMESAQDLPLRNIQHNALQPRAHMQEAGENSTATNSQHSQASADSKLEQGRVHFLAATPEEKSDTSDEVEIILEHTKKNNHPPMTFSGQRNGLASSRYATATPPKQTEHSQDRRSYSQQTLSNPAAFMSAAFARRGSTSNTRHTSMPIAIKTEALSPSLMMIASSEGPSLAHRSALQNATLKANAREQHTVGWPKFPTAADAESPATETAQWDTRIQLYTPDSIERRAGIGYGASPSSQGGVVSHTQSISRPRINQVLHNDENSRIVRTFSPKQSAQRSSRLDPSKPEVPSQSASESASQQFEDDAFKQVSLYTSDQTSPNMDREPLSEVPEIDSDTLQAMLNSMREQGANIATMEQELSMYRAERKNMERTMRLYHTECQRTKALDKNLQKLKRDYADLKNHPPPTHVPSAAEIEEKNALHRDLRAYKAGAERAKVVEFELEQLKRDYTDLKNAPPPPHVPTPEEIAERKALTDKLVACKVECQRLRVVEVDLEIARRENVKLKNIPKSAPATSSTAQADSIRWLEHRQKELELQLELKEPLFKVGRDARHRYLELARMKLFSIPNSKVDQVSMRAGHATANNAVAEADAALLNGGFLSRAQVDSLTPTFGRLYGDLPTQFWKLAPQIQNAIQSLATLTTAYSLNSQACPADVKVEYENVRGYVMKMVQKMNEVGKEEFEADQDGFAKSNLEYIQDSMDILLKFDRKWSRMAVVEKLEREIVR